MPATEARKPKAKKIDAYSADVRITIPLDMSDPNSYADAVDAVQKIEQELPEGATCKITSRMAKVDAPAK